MNDAERVLCAVTARWLAASGRSAGALGLGAGLVAAGGLMLAPAAHPLPAAACAATLLLALPERVLALRLRFDAGLFADLARAPDLRAALGRVDFALQALRLRRAPAQPRSLGERVAGARRLSRQHIGLVLAQVALLAAATVARAAA